ncbi:MAG: T9SS type A sorting domain-containing protein [bacterium]|nr:T9SS type A sorting domain-containing protein [bacterium]
MKRLFLSLIVISIAVPVWAIEVPFGTPVIDGGIDPIYGYVTSEIEVDGNGNAVMDLGSMYACYDNTNVYLYLIVNANLGATNWGKYIIGFDVNSLPGMGGATDPWTRNVNYNDPHRIEYSLNCWVDQAPFEGGNGNDHQYWTWTGGSWSGPTYFNIGSMALDAGVLGSGLEFAIPLASIGNPPTFWVTAWTTGNGGSDNAQDQLPTGWNATDWSTTAQLSNFSQIEFEPPLPVAMTSFTATPASDRITLNWRVESESNNAGFRIFRSTNRESDYEAVSGIITGRGTTSEQMNYHWIDRTVQPGETYYYRIADIDGDGREHMNRFTVQVTAMEPDHNSAMPKVYLMQNAPNPFNNTTNIGFQITTPENLTVALYDLSGRLVKTIASGSYSAGSHTVTLNATGLSAGMYFYRLTTESGFTTQKKLAYLK